MNNFRAIYIWNELYCSALPNTIAKDKLIEPGKAIFQFLISWRQGFSMTILYTFRYLPSSIVVILDYQFQGSVIAMVPIIKQIPKRRCEKSIHRAKSETVRFTIFSTAGSCLDRTLCFFVLTLVHCHSHARLSILRLGECFFRNFSINRTDCGTVGRYKYYFLGPTSRTSGSS